MSENIVPQPSPEKGAPAGAVPEKSGEPQDIETAAEQVITAADVATTAFEREQQRLLESAEREASTGSTPVAQEELMEIKQKSGIAKALQNISDKVREMRDNLKRAAMDRKINRFLAKNQDPETGIRFDAAWVKIFFNDLTPEEIKRHPEIAESTKKTFLYRLKQMADDANPPITTDYANEKKPYLDYDLREIQDLVKLLKSQPEIIEAMVNQPGVSALQNKIFQRCLCDIHNQQYAPLLRDSLLMSKEQAQKIVIDTLTSTVITEDTRYGMNIRHVALACSDFNLDRSTRFALTLTKFQSGMGRDNPYLYASSLRSDFDFTDQDWQDFVAQHRPALERHSYMASFKLLTTDGLSQVRGFWGHLEREFNLQLNVEKFKQQPQAQEQIKGAILTSAKKARIDDPEEYKFLESLSSEPLENILKSPEGQNALYRGASRLVSIGRNAPTVNGFLKKFKLDLKTFQDDPETLQEFRELIQSDIDHKRNFWRNEIISFLQIPDEKIQDLKTLMLANLINLKEYLRAFQLIDSTTFTPEEQKIISQKIFGVDDKFPYLIRIKNLVTDGKKIPDIMTTTLLAQHERFLNKTDQQLEIYIKIAQQIAESPSQEMIRVKDQLIEQILMTENPEKTYDIVQNIFIQNNIPLVGKIQRIFDALFPDKALTTHLQGSSSPVLLCASPRLRRHIIFQDLLGIHIESGNRSLKTFLQLFQQAEPMIAKLESQGGLSPTEQQKLTYVFKKLKTLVDVSQRGQWADFGAIDLSSLTQAHQELRQQLGAKPDQSISERVVEMFTRPLGYSKIDEILTEMNRAKQSADQRSRQATLQKFEVKPGDLAKGVDIKYIDNILQNGSVAKEFLGASSASDATPLDTDVELIGDNGQMTLAHDYGEIIFIIKNRGQFQSTNRQEPKYDKTKYELFHTGALGSQHYGIRTGFPCTEIDFMILKTVDSKQRENLFYNIAQNDYYVPVVDEAHQLIFTPEMYDEYRRCFAGLERFDGQDIKFISSQPEPYYSQLQSIIKEKQQDAERLLKLKTEIRTMALEVLMQFDVKLKPEYDDGIIGAELLDIGSTGRDTNAIGEGDFDFNLKLDAKDFDKFAAIAQEIQKRLGGEMSESPVLPSEGNHYQFRFFGTNVFSQKDVDIDIGFVKKSDLNVYASHDAITDKLANVHQKYGEEAYQEVVANILLTKKWLKAGEAYKKGDYGQGGLGGIGVENLILAYSGNIKTAFRAFAEAAKKSDGSRKGLEEFKKDFKLLDAGMDLRSNHHDNFVYNMNEAGYQRMLDVIQEHFDNF